jgi:hypothetical protein
LIGNGESVNRGGRIGLADQQQDWIEKYRAALDQQPQRVSAFTRLARVFGFALGKTFGKPINSSHINASQESAASRRSPEREVQVHPSPEAHVKQNSPREKSSHQDLPPHQKAS